MKTKKLIVGAAIFALSAMQAFSAMADMPEERKPEDAIFYAEFDGNDDTSLWAKYTVGGDFKGYATVGKVENGNLITEPGTTSFGSWGVYYGLGSDAYQIPVSSKSIMFEMKFKVEGKVADSTIWRVYGRRTSFGETDNIDFADMYIKNGKIGCGDRTGVTVDTGIPVELGKWYTIKSRMDFSGKKVYTDITDESGVTKSFTSNFTWGIEFKNITCFTLHRNDVAGVKYITDYVCLWNDGFAVKGFSVEDGAENVRNDADIDISFTAIPKTQTLDNIVVEDEDGEFVGTEITLDGKTAKVYFPLGLRYNKTYTVTVPNTVVNANDEAVSEKSVTFTTEARPFEMGEIEKRISEDKVSAELKVRNNTTQDKKFYLLIMVYDEEGTLVKMGNIEGNVAKNTESTVSGELDVSGLNVVDVKTYIWNGIII